MSVRALIVDDEPLARQRLRTLLKGESDIELVGECAGGQGAVAAIRVLQPHLLFLDVQMPLLDGFGVLEALGSQQSPDCEPCRYWGHNSSFACCRPFWIPSSTKDAHSARS